MKELQPFQPREGAALDAQLFEVTANVRLHTFQPCPGGGKVVHVHAEGQELCADNAVVAFGDLVFQHFHILTPDAVVIIVLHGDVHAVPAARAAPVVEEGKLERKAAVKVVEAGAPFPVREGLLGGGGNVLSFREQAGKALLFRLSACGLSAPFCCFVQQLPEHYAFLCVLS